MAVVFASVCVVRVTDRSAEVRSLCRSLIGWSSLSLLVQISAFNNRTKEELKMHMFKKCGGSPHPLPPKAPQLW